MKISKHLPYKIDPVANRNHYYETFWKQTALDLLQKHEANLKGLSLLDYGCGRGETMDMANKMGMVTQGTDMDPYCVELASKFGEAKILNLDDPVGQFGEKSFDVVACFHVLEHVPRPLETLIHLRRIARKYVLVAVPNLSRPRDCLRRRNWDTPVNEGHLQSWDHSHFRNLAENHARLELVEWGFDAVKIPVLSDIIFRFFGNNAAVKFETGIFRQFIPFGCISVISLSCPRPSTDVELHQIL